MKETFGYASLEWKEGIDWSRVREYRLARAREAMDRHGLGAMLLMYDENCRYVTSTLTPGWNKLKPGLRYAILIEGQEPILYEQGDIGIHIKKNSPWIPTENVRHSFSWIKGAAGGASAMQVEKFTNAIVRDLEDAGVKDKPLGVDFIDINMMRAFEQAGIDWTDGMTPMMEARAVKSPDEQNGLRIVASICDALHYEMSKFLKPGLTENQVAAFGFEYLYSFPGVEDVEDVIVSSGPNAWPNWRNFSDRIIRPGELVIIDVAALTWNGFKSCVYRTYCVGGEPTAEHEAVLRPRAHVAARFDRRGQTRGDHRRHRVEVAFGHGDLGIRGRRRGSRQPLGPWPRPGAIRPTSDIAHLVARPSGGDPAGDGLRVGDAAREGA